MKIRAATLAGGSRNQDAYIIGENFAGVFDGASNHLANQDSEQDAAWYANLLAALISDSIPNYPTLMSAVADSIGRASALFNGPPEMCPTSTVSLVRWSSDKIEAFVLGDSILATLGSEERHMTDGRIGRVASKTREDYKRALSDGHGFGARHRARLRELQEREHQWRNSVDGYWIAGSAPEAAHHGLTAILNRSDVTDCLLATDGGFSPLTYGLASTWAEVKTSDLGSLLSAAHEVEESDRFGCRFPRSKLHDDKTLVWISFDE